MKIKFKSSNPSIEGISTMFACVVMWCLFTLSTEYTGLIAMGLVGSSVTAYLLMSNLLTYLAQSSVSGKEPGHHAMNNTAQAAEKSASERAAE
jgi:hypothetical protein